MGEGGQARVRARTRERARSPRVPLNDPAPQKKILQEKSNKRLGTNKQGRIK